MSTPIQASQLLTGDFSHRREYHFTHWLSRDLLQAAVDFCKNVGLLPIYAETSDDGRGRYLLWHPPEGTRTEVRSGRSLADFEKLHATATSQGRRLLSLHINGQNLHSAVWVDALNFESAKSHLATFGILPAGSET